MGRREKIFILVMAIGRYLLSPSPPPPPPSPLNGHEAKVV